MAEKAPDPIDMPATFDRNWMVIVLTIAFALQIAGCGNEVLPPGSQTEPDIKIKSMIVQIPETTERIPFVYIPSGTFTLGSAPTDAHSTGYEQPTRRVMIRGFWMSATEIPQSTYTQFWHGDIRLKEKLTREKLYLKEDDPVVLANLDARRRQGPFIRDMDNPGKPARSMSQYAAQQFCKWLSIRIGQNCRLPTEAEWEYACRAGTTSAWFFGDSDAELGEYAWFSRNADGQTHEVALKRPNPWGLYDMYGNVAEWTLDGWTDDHKNIPNPATDPWSARVRKPLARGAVIRGGDHDSISKWCRSAWRGEEDDSLYWMSDDGWMNSGSKPARNKPEPMQVGFRIIIPDVASTDGRDQYLKPITDGPFEHDREP